MTKRRKQAIILLALSGPMMWWGFTNFMAGGISSTIQAIGVAIGCVFGGFAALSGLTMLITKNSLGILNPDDKGRGETLASQTSKDSPILDGIYRYKIRQRNEAAIDNLVTKTTDNAIKTLTKKRKVNEMAKAKDTDVANVVEEIRALEELIVQTEERIKKDTLDVKTATETKAVLKDNLARNKTVKELLAIIKQ